MTRQMRVPARATDNTDPAATSGAAGPVALSLWLRLLKVHGLVLREARRSVGPELTLPRFDVMAQLSRSGEGLTFVELSRRLLVTAGNLTGIVDRLVRDGLVARTTDRTDRRARRLRLTPAGRRLMSRLLPRHARDIETLMAGVSASELRALRGLLGKLAGDIERRTRSGVATRTQGSGTRAG